MALMPAVSPATGQVLSTRSPVDHGHRPVTLYCDVRDVRSTIFGSAQGVV